MIKGDIDLTEKLDFYHDKPKDDNKLLPALPWKKEYGVVTTDSEEASRWIYHYLGSNPRISVVNSDIELAWSSLDTDLNYYPTSTATTTISTNYNSNLTFTYNSWNDEPIVSYNTNTTTMNITWTSNNNWNGVITTFDGQPISLGHKSDLYKKKPLDLPYKIKPKEDSYTVIKYCDCCGKKFIRADKGFYCKECQEKQNKKNLFQTAWQNIRRSAWTKNDYLRGYFVWQDERYQNIFPWDNDGIYSSHQDEIIDSAQALRELKRRVGSATKRLRDIPWLTKLNSRIFDDYKEELENGEKDYSSYLTNMGWLGIH